MVWCHFCLFQYLPSYFRELDKFSVTTDEEKILQYGELLVT